MLITLICGLFIFTAYLSYSDLKASYEIRKKIKPKSALECFFCENELHEESRLKISLICLHPKGLDLPSEKSPLACTEYCSYAMHKKNDLSIEKAVKHSSFSNLILFEVYRLSAILVTSLIAIVKLTGVL